MNVKTKLSDCLRPLLLGAAFLATSVQAEVRPLDRVVSIVDTDVIMQSQLDQRVREVQQTIAKRGDSLPPEHVLTKAFYLLQDFPGRYAGGQLWVEQAESRVNDGVSSLIIGGSDWAGAWAVDDSGRAMFPVIPGGEGQREMAYRFGVNLVMYALTGNYKADQVHVPAILERLGQ